LVAFAQIVFLSETFIHLFATLFFPSFLLDFGKAVFKLFVLQQLLISIYRPYFL
jgi:hypothetical protein